jgi:hypothetical protein
MIDEFYLQSPHGNTGDGLMFWALGGGYCTDLDRAEVFTRDRAQKLHEDRCGDDIPWPKAYIDQRAHLGVDHQYVRAEEAAPMLVEGCQCVVQVKGEWNGNDLIWARWPIGTSPKFEQAHRISLEHAKRLSENEIIWPLAYIETKTRRLVHQGKLSLAEALSGSGIKRFKRKRTRYTYRCEPCGRFLTESQNYGACPNCGACNAP